MLISKRLVGTAVLVSLPTMLWQAEVSAGIADQYRPPNVILKAGEAITKGHADRALDLLAGRAASLRHPTDQAQAHALICQAYYQKRDYVTAEKSCDVAVTTGKPNWSHLNNRGVMRFQLGRFGEALQDFRKAASIMLSASKSQSRSVRRNVIAAQRQVASR